MYLLVGGDSEIGAATARLLRQRGMPAHNTTRRRVAGSGRPFLDFNDALSFEPPAGTKAACIFVAVARLAACANDPPGSRRINVTQTLSLIDRLTARGIYSLWLSTNQVFDGSVAKVVPDAPHSPISEYGRQKAETETALKAMMSAGRPVGILRLAKVVSPGMKLLSDWDAALRAGMRITAFSDMRMAPTPIAMVSEAIARLIDAREASIFQLTGPRDVTYAEVAHHLAKRAGVSSSLVEAGSALDQTLGVVSEHTTLDSTRLRERFGLVVPDPMAVIDAAIAAR